jgi:hypothetical protein
MRGVASRVSVVRVVVVAVSAVLACIASSGLTGGCGARTGLDIPIVVTTPCYVSAPPSGTTLRTCESGATSISGTVYDPALRHPLYDVVVYVPSTTLDPIPSGPSCDTNSCASAYSGNPIATTLTDANGHFTLSGVPDGTNVPLVVQVGKWRRQLTVPNVAACQDNPLPDKSVSLPKNHTEGNIPNIAVSTGGADTLECIFRRMGIDPSEYVGGPAGPGRIHVFQGAGADGGTATDGGLHEAPTTSPPAPLSYQSLWDTDADIFAYDMVFLSCEGAETWQLRQQVLFDYASAGGRVFGSHYHYAWFDTGPFAQGDVASWLPGGGNMGNINAIIETTLPGGQPFPQGAALAAWLGNAGALTNGELPIVQARHNADVHAMNTDSEAWIVADQAAIPPGATQYFSFNMPFGVDPSAQCGQVVFSDIHVGAASNDDPSEPVPEECANIDLSPQELALEFVLFNLSACVTPTGETPTAPPACLQR